MLRRFFSHLPRTVLALAVLGLATAGSAKAQAIVINDFNCQVTSGGWAQGGQTLFSSESIVVISDSGNFMLNCRFDIPEGLEPATAVRLAVNCFFGANSGTGMTISTPGGEVTGTCTVNNNAGN